MRRGFTLIELMIVVAIIVILSAVAIPYYTRLQAHAGKARVVSDFRTIRDSLEQYHSDWGVYPITGEKAEPFGWNVDYVHITSAIAKELTGDSATLNTPQHVNSIGEHGGMDYFTREWIIRKMKNPFDQRMNYYYYSLSGDNFYLVCPFKYKGQMQYIESSNEFNFKQVKEKPDWMP